MDYTSTPITATFTAGTTSTKIDVPVTRDAISENVETFDLTITIPSSLNGVFDRFITTAVGTIIDNTSKQLVVFTSTSVI